jgi:hypothetical protein
MVIPQNNLFYGWTIPQFFCNSAIFLEIYIVYSVWNRDRPNDFPSSMSSLLDTASTTRDSQVAFILLIICCSSSRIATKSPALIFDILNKSKP